MDAEDELRVKLSIIINKELVFELALLGDSVKVVSPPALVQELADFLRSAWRQYA